LRRPENFISVMDSIVSRRDRMKLYLKLYFSSEGASALDIIQKIEKMGFSPNVGEYDLVIDFTTPEEYGEIITSLHDMLKGSNTMYRVMTKRE
jgi:hypothetical protein